MTTESAYNTNTYREDNEAVSEPEGAMHQINIVRYTRYLDDVHAIVMREVLIREVYGTPRAQPLYEWSFSASTACADAGGRRVVYMYI